MARPKPRIRIIGVRKVPIDLDLLARALVEQAEAELRAEDEAAKRPAPKAPPKAEESSGGA